MRFNLIFSEAPKALDCVWIVGDSFLRDTYGKIFQTSTELQSGYVKSHYEVKTVDGNDAYSSNLLASLVNSLIKRIEREVILPNYIIIVFDDDIIRWCKFDEFGISEVYGRLTKWLAYQFDRAVKTQMDYLPEKSKKMSQPQFIWMGASNHRDLANNLLRKKFNDSLTSAVEIFPNMESP